MEKDINEVNLFVPGRLCLFGEHSDWAGGHRRQNYEIEKGYAIVAPTNQGNYATARKLKESMFIFNSLIFGKLESLLKDSELLKIAEDKNNPLSYVAGVAHEVIISYNRCHRGGIEINNYKTDLPVKKGLSSSASVCVLVARAFNEVFKLNWTKRREMEVAYLGEITTPSRCGKLDQACAYDNPVLMSFDADKLGIQELEVGGDFYFLIADLNGKKDTKKILAALNWGFPFPENELEKEKHKYLGPINRDIVFRATNAIKNGDAKKIGEIMIEAQKNFDRYLAPHCPEELTAPKLHEVLNLEEIKPYVHGGKGVGSQGDGSVQFVCKSFDDRIKLKSILESQGYSCLDLDFKKNI